MILRTLIKYIKEIFLFELYSYIEFKTFQCSNEKAGIWQFAFGNDINILNLPI